MVGEIGFTDFPFSFSIFLYLEKRKKKRKMKKEKGKNKMKKKKEKKSQAQAPFCVKSRDFTRERNRSQQGSRQCARERAATNRVSRARVKLLLDRRRGARANLILK